MSETTIAFIGAGNIAQAIVGGLIDSGYPPGKICAADPQTDQLAAMPGSIATYTNNDDAISDAAVVVFCLKPNLVPVVAEALVARSKGRLFISVAAGITTDTLMGILGEETAIIRCMPNTPALVGQGMTGLYANLNVSPDQREIASRVLSAVGKAIWFDDESALDAVTAVSGSGPAYFFLMMEAMEQAARNLGIPAPEARELVIQTALGAASMAAASEDSPEALRLKVTSPRGTTEAAINSLLGSDVVGAFERAINAAHQRSIELSGKDGA
jgi:pyrroline-5-carboxylate reductase